MGSQSSSSQHGVSLWHEGFAECVRQRAPAGFQIISEYQLSLRPRRADVLVLRRTEHSDDDGRILRALWPRLAQVAIIEFKSPSRGFRRSDLIRLTSYGSQYHADRMNGHGSPDDLTLVLVAPCSNGALIAELDNMGWNLRDLGDGYAQIVGTCYTTFVAFTNHVSDAERDDFLRIFSDRDVQTLEAQHWLESWITMKEQDVTKREGYDDMLDKLLRSLPPERRLAGIPPEQTLLALPDEFLRALSDEFIQTLPVAVQNAIRKRLAGPHG